MNDASAAIEADMEAHARCAYCTRRFQIGQERCESCGASVADAAWCMARRARYIARMYTDPVTRSADYGLALAESVLSDRSRRVMLESRSGRKAVS